MGGINFTLLKSVDEKIEFYKPYRSNRSRIFSEDENKYNYGYIRDDVMNVDETYYSLNCNTNTSYPIERDKYKMINYIIKHSNSELNPSDRTKLAIMDEEELIRKAVELKIPLKDLNEYTKPKLVSNVKDIWNPNLFGTGKGGFQIWDNLQSKYLNIHNKHNKNKTVPKLGLKVWNYERLPIRF